MLNSHFCHYHSSLQIFPRWGQHGSLFSCDCKNKILSINQVIQTTLIHQSINKIIIWITINMGLKQRMIWVYNSMVKFELKLRRWCCLFVSAVCGLAAEWNAGASPHTRSCRVHSSWWNCSGRKSKMWTHCVQLIFIILQCRRCIVLCFYVLDFMVKCQHWLQLETLLGQAKEFCFSVFCGFIQNDLGGRAVLRSCPEPFKAPFEETRLLCMKCFPGGSGNTLQTLLLRDNRTTWNFSLATSVDIAGHIWPTGPEFDIRAFTHSNTDLMSYSNRLWTSFLASQTRRPSDRTEV